MSVCTCVQVLTRARRRAQIPWTWSFRCLWTTWLLGTELCPLEGQASYLTVKPSLPPNTRFASVDFFSLLESTGSIPLSSLHILQFWLVSIFSYYAFPICQSDLPHTLILAPTHQQLSHLGHNLLLSLFCFNIFPIEMSWLLEDSFSFLIYFLIEFFIAVRVCAGSWSVFCSAI